MVNRRRNGDIFGVEVDVAGDSRAGDLESDEIRETAEATEGPARLEVTTVRLDDSKLIVVAVPHEGPDLPDRDDAASPSMSLRPPWNQRSRPWYP